MAKIRLQFVSNSSSASFILRINDITFEKFTEEFKEEYGWQIPFKVFNEETKETDTTMWVTDEVFQDRFKELLEEGGIKYEVVRGSDLSLSHYTTMYNSMDEGPSKMFQRFILLFCYKLKSKYKTESEIDDEGHW